MKLYSYVITSKRIELESPGWSGFVTDSKPDQTIFHAESNEAGLKVRKLTVFKQRSFEVVEYAN